MTDFFLGHSLDPLPMPDDVEEQANHHDVAAVGVDVRDIKRRRMSKVLWMVKILDI